MTIRLRNQTKAHFGARAYLGEDVFICEMHSSLLWSRANFVALFNEALVLIARYQYHLAYFSEYGSA